MVNELERLKRLASVFVERFLDYIKKEFKEEYGSTYYRLRWVTVMFSLLLAPALLIGGKLICNASLAVDEPLLSQRGRKDERCIRRASFLNRFWSDSI